MDVPYAVFQLKAWREATEFLPAGARENFAGVAAAGWLDHLVARHFSETVQVREVKKDGRRYRLAAIPYAPDRVARFAYMLRSAETCDKLLLPNVAVPAAERRNPRWFSMVREALTRTFGIDVEFHDSPRSFTGYTAEEALIFDGQLDAAAPAEKVYRNPHEKAAYLLAGGARALGIEAATSRRRHPVTVRV